MPDLSEYLQVGVWKNGNYMLRRFAHQSRDEHRIVTSRMDRFDRVTIHRMYPGRTYVEGEAMAEWTRDIGYGYELGIRCGT